MQDGAVISFCSVSIAHFIAQTISCFERCGVLAAVGMAGKSLRHSDTELLPFTFGVDLGLPNNSFVKMHRKSSTLEQVELCNYLWTVKYNVWSNRRSGLNL